MWRCLEVNFGIAAACIPALYPGYKALSRNISAYRSGRRTSYPRSEKELLPPSAVPATAGTPTTDGAVVSHPSTSHHIQGVQEGATEGIRRTVDIETQSQEEERDLDVELGIPEGLEGRTGRQASNEYRF
ncbi:hypothetical protein MMC18_004047 [Xylographa bjoerkii]|nr:hypothetical protein [Xylographa bjoerkii]